MRWMRGAALYSLLGPFRLRSRIFGLDAHDDGVWLKFRGDKAFSLHQRHTRGVMWLTGYFHPSVDTGGSHEAVPPEKVIPHFHS